MRLFFAVKISDAIRADVESAIQSFPLRNPPWRWIPTGNMHLTLKFLGEVDERILGDLKDAGAAAASEAQPFRVAYGAFGGFPTLSNPRVIFFEAKEGARELAKVARSLESLVEPLGVERERRPFKAHLTLARIKEPLPHGMTERLGAVPPLPATAFQTVDRFMLMRSHLAPSGATYEEVGSFALGTGA
jgi:RNA 2',3'-cyclic 3'-phosphodiesterase